MNKKSLSFWLRMGTGTVLTAAGIMLATSVGIMAFPEIVRPAVSLDVGSFKNDKSIIVCQGPFTVIGLDTANPDKAIPVGVATERINIADHETIDLEYDAGANINAKAYLRQNLPQIAGAQAQKLSTDTVKGATAAACDTPTSDQWLVSGSTTVGMATTLTLSNPGDVAATVQITVFDEDPSDDLRSEAGFLVPPASQRVVSLNSFGVNKKSLVTRVTSTGSPVVATVSLTEIHDLTPTGAETTNSQSEPKTRTVFVGVEQHIDHVHGVEGEDDEIPAVVRVLAPEEDGSATITGVNAQGKEIDLGTFEFKANHVFDHEIGHLPEDVRALIVTATTPVVAGVKTAVLDGANYDFTWMAPSSVFNEGEEMQLVPVASSVATILNLGDKEAHLLLVAENDPAKTKEIKIPAGGVVKTGLDASYTMTSNTPVAAGFIQTDKRTIATYPVLKQAEGVDNLRLFPR